MTLKPEFAGKTQFISGRNENNEPVVTILKTVKTEEEVKLAEVDAEEEVFFKPRLGNLNTKNWLRDRSQVKIKTGL